MHASQSSPDTLFRCPFRGFVGSVFAVLLTIAGASPAFAQQAAVNPARVTQVVDDSVRTILKGNIHPLARAEYDKGPANASLPADRMQLVLQRSPNQEIALGGNFSGSRCRIRIPRSTTSGSPPSSLAPSMECRTPTF